jgi:phosphoglycolate phosphatase
MIKAVIFDLDGTLLNTIDDITDSLNIALSSCGFRRHTAEETKMHVGSGVKVLVQRALAGAAFTDRQFSCVEARYLQEYSARQATKTTAYPGLIHAIDELRSMGVKTAVLSNKPHQDTLKTVEHFFTPARFDLVLGQREGVPPKPDPAALYGIIKELGVAKEECLFVGDSDVDMKTAENAGIKKIGVLWGFRDRRVLEASNADYIIDKAERIVEIVKGMPAPGQRPAL